MAKHWYDFAVSPFQTVSQVCEGIEDKGWEVVGAFNTGAVGRTSQLLSPGKTDLVPMIGILARIERTGDAQDRPLLNDPFSKDRQALSPQQNEQVREFVRKTGKALHRAEDSEQEQLDEQEKEARAEQLAKGISEDELMNASTWQAYKHAQSKD